MNVFKRKSIYLAVAAGLGAVGGAGGAAAVTLSQSGTGEVLIYPYYTVRNGSDTYISVTNTTASAKAVKVRFLEGKNSREVLDFNLYLSPNDMWSGAVVATADGARLVTRDKSCSGLPAANSQGVISVDFVNYAYGGTNTETAAGAIPDTALTSNTGDFENQTLDRSREGYFEIIEMGTITLAALQTAVTHNSAGNPANCQVANALTSVTAPAAMVEPTGGLEGNATIINVASGMDFSFDPVALAAFSTAVIWDTSGSIRPDMRDVTPKTSVVFKGNLAITSNWARALGSAADPVTAVLMHDRLMNDFVLDTATLSGTDWVITMPTKRHYIGVDGATGAANTLTAVPITPFTTDFFTGGACEPFVLDYYNREERTTVAGSVSPTPPGTSSSLCWESTILTFNNSDVLGSSNKVSQPLDASYENGWARISFNGASNTMVDAAAVTYVGLPAIGFMVQDFVNGDVGGVLSNYGGSFIHKYRTNIGGVVTE